MVFVFFFLLPFRIFQVFGGFDFTDPEDFAPLLTLGIGLICAASIVRFSPKKASVPLICSLLILTLWPILPNFGLYFMARELQSVRGTWPQVMIDDPKNAYGYISSQYDALYHVVNYLEAFSGAWMIIFVALYFATKSRLSRAQQRLCLGSMAFTLLLFLIDFGNLYAWWLD